MSVISTYEDIIEAELLGEVVHVQGNENAPQFCRVRPTYQQLNDSWVPITDSKSSFPDIGLIFWWRPAGPIKKGDAFQFHVVDDPTHYKEGQQLDRFQIRGDTAKAPIEVIKLAQDCDLAALRRTIAAGTLSTPFPSLGYALVEPSGSAPRWIGLFEPKPYDEKEKPKNALVCDTSSGFIRSYDSNQSLAQTIRVDDIDHLLLRPGAVLSPIGYFNVQTDMELVRALANLVRRESDTVDAELFRKRAIEDSLKILSPGGPGTRDRQRDGARLEAAQGLQRDLDVSDREREQIQNILERLPVIETIKAGLRTEFEEEYARRFAQIDKDVHAAFEAERQTANRELSETINRTNALKAEALQLVSDTKNALGTLVDHAVVKISEHAVIRRLLKVDKDDPGGSYEGIAPTEQLRSLDDIGDHVMTVANSCGEDAYVATVLAALMAGSQTCLLAGSRAFSLASTLAHSLGGGGSCVVPMAPTIFSFGDLLNAACAPIGKLPCHADWLGEFISNGIRRDHLSVVILHGVNRTAPENVLLELIDSAFNDFDQPIRWRDSNGKVRTVLLDKRILFLATMTDGSSTMPIPRNLGIRLPLLWSDRQEMRGRSGPSTSAPSASVAFDVWKATSGKKWEGGGPAVGKLEAFSEYAALHDVNSKFVRGVCGILGDTVGVAEAIWSVTCGRLKDEELKTIGIAFNADQAKRWNSAVESGESERMRSYFLDNESDAR